MKLHWGHGIAIFLTVFVLILVIALISSMRMDHQLVSDDYYAEDLAYQSRYTKEADQLASDNLLIVSDAKDGTVVLQFDSDAGPVSGKAHFYRPSDAKLDLIIDLENNNNTETIDYSQLRPGKWLVKVDWRQGGVDYYKEQILIL